MPPLPDQAIPQDPENEALLKRLMSDPTQEKRIANLRYETEEKFSELMLRVRHLKDEYGRSEKGREVAIVFTELEKVYGYWHTFINPPG